MGQIRKLLSSLTLRQQISIVAAMVAVGARLWLLARWNRERDFVPLYSNLSAEDGGAVMAKLKEENVEYRVDGNMLRVPSDKVAEIRLRMASEGLPKTSRIGFELFDKSNFGLTEFADRVVLTGHAFVAVYCRVAVTNPTNGVAVANPSHSVRPGSVR